MTRLHTEISAQDHIQGPIDAPMMVVEYGDYQCPFCAAAYPAVKRLQQRLGDRLGYVFRHFPLSQLHPYAIQTSEAAEAAGAQGRFWEMHALLFENQDHFEPAALTAYARALDLDLPQFADDLAQHRFLKKIRRDFMGGARSGVNGTPSFFLNGFLYRGPFTADALFDAITGGPSTYV